MIKNENYIPLQIDGDAIDDRKIQLLQHERSRKEKYGEKLEQTRRHLLIVSIVGLTITVTDAIPTKVSALGIEFSSVSKMGFLIIIAAVTLYFVIRFWMRSIAMNFFREELLYLESELRKYYEGERQYSESLLNSIWAQRWIGFAPIFERWFPTLLGLTSIIWAMFEALKLHRVSGVP